MKLENVINNLKKDNEKLKKEIEQIKKSQKICYDSYFDELEKTKKELNKSKKEIKDLIEQVELLNRHSLARELYKYKVGDKVLVAMPKFNKEDKSKVILDKYVGEITHINLYGFAVRFEGFTTGIDPRDILCKVGD